MRKVVRLWLGVMLLFAMSAGARGEDGCAQQGDDQTAAHARPTVAQALRYGADCALVLTCPPRTKATVRSS